MSSIECCSYSNAFWTSERNSFSYLTELWDNPFAVQLLYCSWTIIDKHLCHLDCRHWKHKKYITLLCMLYYLGVHILLAALSVFPRCQYNIIFWGTANAVLFLLWCREWHSSLQHKSPGNAQEITQATLANPQNNTHYKYIHPGGKHIYITIPSNVIKFTESM